MIHIGTVVKHLINQKGVNAEIEWLFPDCVQLKICETGKREIIDSEIIAIDGVVYDLESRLNRYG